MARRVSVSPEIGNAVCRGGRTDHIGMEVRRGRRLAHRIVHSSHTLSDRYAQVVHAHMDGFAE